MIGGKPVGDGQFSRVFGLARVAQEAVRRLWEQYTGEVAGAGPSAISPPIIGLLSGPREEAPELPQSYRWSL